MSQTQKPPKVTVKTEQIIGGLTDVSILYVICEEEDGESIGRLALKKPYDKLNDYNGLAQRIADSVNKEIEERFQRIKAIFPDYEVTMYLKDFAEHYTANFDLRETLSASQPKTETATSHPEAGEHE